MEHIIVNFDAYGHQIGKNMSAFIAAERQMAALYVRPGLADVGGAIGEQQLRAAHSAVV